MIIHTQIRFESAHRLPNVPDGHKCGRLHGHSYVATIYVTGEPDLVTGWVMDFGDIREKAEPLRRQLDHYYLNDIPGLQNPTSETLCVWIWDRLKPIIPQLSRISVSETCTSGCDYEGP